MVFQAGQAGDVVQAGGGPDGPPQHHQPRLPPRAGPVRPVRRPAVHPQPPVQNQQPLAQPLQQPLMPPPAAVPAQAPHPAQNIIQQELDMQEVDPNELQGAAALIPLPATPRQELQNDLQLANRMQELQDSVERGPQFFTPQEQ